MLKTEKYNKYLHETIRITCHFVISYRLCIVTDFHVAFAPDLLREKTIS